ncbi:isoprenoid biosynthesis glyoxalase ElbB [Fangia hongkongensis]|uniref:isoprenoid biosynthesis glyoxalase ElbB n=1 Tax=Fangia hongkongensis TaxID=270495 RepID=UPI0003638984|nr:isoprenoid biosynthesis glyoxalase ElbB [Fangia hongkongensis]MBK2123724.1 isoprenoid biosynthesis glyoxalase ElbB [Fangia hongkongensis]
MKIAVVLSGSGVFDGAEIHESVLTLLALCKRGIEHDVIAPNVDQYHVINHVTGTEMNETRNVLIESARIARGEIKDLSEVKSTDYDALILPGGFGAAKNLFDFAIKQNADYTILPMLKSFICAFRDAGKPVGFICISPMMIPEIYPKGVKLTIGNDSETAKVAMEKGATHVDTKVDEICVDYENQIVSTAAYMTQSSIYEISLGIDKLVEKVCELAKNTAPLS